MTVAITEGGLNDIQISDDPYDYNQVDVTNTPCAITLSRVRIMLWMEINMI